MQIRAHSPVRSLALSKDAVVGIPLALGVLITLRKAVILLH